MLTAVETRPAPERDANVIDAIHESLAKKNLLSETHFVDMGYMNAPGWAKSQSAYNVELFGPVLPDTSWQAKQPDAYDISQFSIDWEAKTATCPQGEQSHAWTERTDRYEKPLINIRFRSKICRYCPDKPLCANSPVHGRQLNVRPQVEHEMIQACRQIQDTAVFRSQYALRSGVEGAISQAVYALRMRRTRYRGRAKAHLQHLATAAAINMHRAVSWFLGFEPATTRLTRFAALAPS